MSHTISFDTLAHKLLDELDARHDELLAELDSLNARVDAVLSQYVTVQPDTALRQSTNRLMWTTNSRSRMAWP